MRDLSSILIGLEPNGDGSVGVKITDAYRIIT